jgi:transposase
MTRSVRVRRLTDAEARSLLRIARRGKPGTIQARRAMIVLASSRGAGVPAIAGPVVACQDTVRRVIHGFNATGLAALGPHWAGGRPRLIGDADITVIIATGTTRPKKLGMPFTHWSLRKLSAYLRGGYRNTGAVPAHLVAVGRERLRQILHAHRITFQHTRTWRESTDPDFDAKLDRIEDVTTRFPDRCFAFDQFGPLSIRPYPPHPRDPLLPRLLRPGQRLTPGHPAPTQGRRPRDPVRAAADLHHGQLQLPQPHRPGPRPPGPPALAQHQLP